MRVVMPFAGVRRDERAVEALLAQAPDAELVDVSASPTAYFELLCDVWDAQVDTLVVEHDVVIAAGTIETLEACPWAWCSCPATAKADRWAAMIVGRKQELARLSAMPEIAQRLRERTEHGYAAAFLQCNRFRRELMVAQPDLVSSVPLSRQHWANLDSNVLPNLKPPAYAAQRGHVHIHEELLTEHGPAAGPPGKYTEAIVNWRNAHGEPHSIRRITDKQTARRSPRA